MGTVGSILLIVIAVVAGIALLPILLLLLVLVLAELTSSPSEKEGYAGCAGSTLFFLLLVIVFPPFMLLDSCWAALRRSILTRRMKSAGRYQPELDPATAAGTLLCVQRCNDHRSEYWWTPEDVRALFPDFEALNPRRDVEVDCIEEGESEDDLAEALDAEDDAGMRFDRELKRLAARYLDVDSGTAVLIGFSHPANWCNPLSVPLVLLRCRARVDSARRKCGLPPVR